MTKNNQYCVYKHTSPSGKCYIGITRQNPIKRWGQDGCNYVIKLKNGNWKHPAFAPAILKYGWKWKLNDGGSGAAHPDAKKLADELKSLMNVKNIELNSVK